jgi:hypothetical protein
VGIVGWWLDETITLKFNAADDDGGGHSASFHVSKVGPDTEIRERTIGLENFEDEGFERRHAVTPTTTMTAISDSKIPTIIPMQKVKDASCFQRSMR